MRWGLWLILLAAACDTPDGGACESWSDCESETCGGGVCLGSECPCENGWDCTPGNCDLLFGCDGLCRQPCAQATDCPADQECQGVPDIDGTYCVYVVPDVPATSDGPYVGAVGEPVTLTVTVELPDGFEIGAGYWYVPTSARIAERVGEPRIEGGTLSEDVVFWTTETAVLADVTIVDPRSAETWNDQFKQYASTQSEVVLTCSADGGPCNSYASCCQDLRCYAGDGEELVYGQDGRYGTCAAPPP